MASCMAAGARLGGARKMGAISDRYCLQETPARNYQQRTKWNVRDSDATLIVTLAAELTGGSLFTHEWARKINRPCLHVYPSNKWHEWIKVFLETNPIRVLNVAGPRNSSAAGAGIEQFVYEVLSETFPPKGNKNLSIYV